jgi:hypothetical protein
MSDIPALGKQLDQAVDNIDSDAAAKILEEVGACGVQALHDASHYIKTGWAPLTVDYLPDNKEKIAVLHYADYASDYRSTFAMSSVIVDRCNKQ